MRRSWPLLLLLAAGSSSAQETQPKPPAAPSRPRHVEQLKPVAKVVLGTYMGAAGEAASGALSGAWGLNQTAILLQTRTGAKGRTRSEHMWAFTWDDAAKRLRCRIVGEGLVITFDVAASEAEGEASLALTEVARDGASGPKVAIQLKRTRAGLSLNRKVGEAGVQWALEPLGRSPSQQGPFPPTATKLKIPRPGGKEFLEAQVHFPKKGKGPFPVIVLSPGGKAARPRGYELFAQWWATWGWAVVVVGFGDTPSPERATRFGWVADWLTVANVQPGWPLAGKLHLKMLVAAGHSRGGHAALLAAQQDKRFTACLALAPAGPKSLGEGLKKPVAFISGAREARACQQLYASTQAPKLQVAIAGMDHFFRPRERARHVLSHSTAFLMGLVGKRKVFVHWLELTRQRGIGVAISRGK